MENYFVQLNQPSLGTPHSIHDHPIAALMDYRESLRVECKRMDRVIEFLSVNNERVSIVPKNNAVAISGDSALLKKLIEIELSE